MPFLAATPIVELAVGLALTALGGAADSEPPSHEAIGRSVDDRPIELRRAGDRGAPTKVLVVGQIHGSEAAGRPVTRDLRRREPPANVELLLVKDLNPDGLAKGTRQNARGVDLNRNFPDDWERQGRPGDRHYSGERPLSEPESRAAKRMIDRERPDVTIWYHQAASLVVERPGVDRSLTRRYAELTGLPAGPYARLPGTVVGWQNDRYPGGDAFVVELGGGKLSRSERRRHVRAVHVLARMARPG